MGGNASSSCYYAASPGLMNSGYPGMCVCFGRDKTRVTVDRFFDDTSESSYTSGEEVLYHGMSRSLSPSTRTPSTLDGNNLKHRSPSMQRTISLHYDPSSVSALASPPSHYRFLTNIVAHPSEQISRGPSLRRQKSNGSGPKTNAKDEDEGAKAPTSTRFVGFTSNQDGNTAELKFPRRSSASEGKFRNHITLNVMHYFLQLLRQKVNELGRKIATKTYCGPVLP